MKFYALSLRQNFKCNQSRALSNIMQFIPLLMKKVQSFEKPNGSGLGLYYAKKVLESRGGTVSLSSRIGEGTIVTLALPLDPNPVRLKTVDSVLIDREILPKMPAWRL